MDIPMPDTVVIQVNPHLLLEHVRDGLHQHAQALEGDPEKLGTLSAQARWLHTQADDLTEILDGAVLGEDEAWVVYHALSKHSLTKRERVVYREAMKKLKAAAQRASA
jgi:hypothetical protein